MDAVTPARTSAVMMSSAPLSSGATDMHLMAPAPAESRVSRAAMSGASNPSAGCAPRAPWLRKGPSTLMPSTAAPLPVPAPTACARMKAAACSHAFTIAGSGDDITVGRNPVTPRDAAKRAIA
ncbi:MAG: hypothetical protein BWY85_01815 [Firmicutes bacterium ADurb.Bin506]|nr:MAG: hypothetical protein BWY85_01815 [Firmicutes bacterium ADurb.Bin506]